LGLIFFGMAKITAKSKLPNSIDNDSLINENWWFESFEDNFNKHN